MGCSSSLLQAGGRRKKMVIPEVVVFVPTMQIPLQTELLKGLKGLIPKDNLDHLIALRNRVVLLSEDTDLSAIPEIKLALEEYLPVLLGITKKEYGATEAVQFKWRTLDDRKQEICVSNSLYEILSVVYMLAVLTLVEANTLLVPQQYPGSSDRIVSTDCQRDAVDLLLKASGYLEFCVKNIFPQLGQDVKKKLHKDMNEGALEALSLQALGQGTALQLGLAIENQKATLSVKRRLACEQLTYFTQAHHALSEGKTEEHDAGKQTLFIRYKFLEAKAAAYFYHGLIVDKSNEPHINALSCFVAAEELLTENKRACLSFCLATPVSRAPPLWGAMKHFHQKIPDTASKKSQLYGYLLDQEKGLPPPPELPEFQLSLRPDDYELPEIDPCWNRDKWEILGQPLKEHLEDSEDEIETESV
ncbi:uncharacterized protein LOC130809214 [Amaranthus tricolor]|uniref:uncharacterized protein LOC130809214 n=1 Tax=Amaranthus tricolor TaxID=29722 RepID=UPI00258E7861|nr:uncharacterized protein LOC130809214 [Amaranthus tricolor]XP_057530875.1 uncharacterized protein LOC130809214 [Amaranthus tricolor]XP_057530876.1 uncharacterized protein LOC130809214 [Amaranthus tricolor]XP_057530877.1 uncharacterized protein LOC130809214 [Amaranthus tricolor]